MSMASSYIELPKRDVTLHIRMRVGDDPNTTPLLLLHGWPASSRGWERVVAAMTKTRTVICPDLRGLGLSERKGDVQHFTKLELAKDIAELVDAVGFGTFYIAGQDWGGTVAQEIALMMPDRARALIIMNINLINNLEGNLKGFQTQMMSPLNPRWYMAFQSAPDLAEAMIPGHEDLWVRYFFTNGAGKDAKLPEQLMRGYIEDYQRSDTPRCGASFYRAMPADVERWLSLAEQKFTQPSLLIYGDQDPFLVPDFYHNYEACFERISRVDLPGGHFIQDERPNEVALEIGKFLDKLNMESA